MERVLGGTDKVLIDQSGQGVVPYLPLNELQPRRPQGGQPPQQPAQGAPR
jgi:membrane protease subunit HflK